MDSFLISPQIYMLLESEMLAEVLIVSIKVCFGVPTTHISIRSKKKKRSHLDLFYYWTGFSKNPSFKIAMSGRLGGRRSRLTFWLTFFQSYMLPLFFSGLLSYLVGMKRRTSRCFPCI